MLIQHDNARPHTSLRTQEAITKFVWIVLPHPPSPPIIMIWRRPIFIFFGPLKNALRGTSFENDDSVIRAVRSWLLEQETS